MTGTLSKLRTAVLAASNLLFINVLRVASAVAHDETLTFGDHAFRASNNGEDDDDTIAVDLSAVTTAASGTLTITSSNAQNDETVVVGSKTYTWKTTLTGAANEVLIGADEAESADNLAAAINGSAGAGTTYGTGTTASTQVTADSSAEDGTVVLTAILKGTGGNSIATTETMTNGSFANATLTSGANATASAFTTALETAVNAAGVKLLAERISANEVLFVDISGASQQRGKTCSETMAGTNNVWSANASYGGDQSITPPRTLITSRVPTATEVTLEQMHFALPFSPVSAIVQIRSSAGLVRAFDGKVTIGGNIVDVISDGSVKVQASDVVTICAYA